MLDSVPKHSKMSTIIDGIKAIIDDYDGYLIDQWGVLHDGERPHDGAIDTLKNLKKYRKNIVLISNSARRPQASKAMLNTLGFDENCYDAVVTSGSLTYDYLRQARNQLGNKVRLYSWKDPSDLLDGLNLEIVNDTANADFMLFAGTEKQNIADYHDDLQTAHQKGLVLVCANPDKISISPEGHMKICPGTIAEHYAKMGGKIISFGKPHPSIYQKCLDKMPKNLLLSRLIAIGDSLEHDIAGANNIGCHSLLIANGIHRHELTPLNQANVENFCKKNKTKKSIHADYICKKFCL